MKKITFFLLIIFLMILLALAGCEIEKREQGKETTPREIIKDDKETPLKEAECLTDSDCVKGGCSGTVCQSKNAEPVFTTCEFRPEYACYRQISCSCVKGQCSWEKTKEFEDCVTKAG